MGGKEEVIWQKGRGKIEEKIEDYQEKGVEERTK
jgi:hypothetical protein